TVAQSERGHLTFASPAGSRRGWNSDRKLLPDHFQRFVHGHPQGQLEIVEVASVAGLRVDQILLGAKLLLKGTLHVDEVDPPGRIERLAPRGQLLEADEVGAAVGNGLLAGEQAEIARGEIDREVAAELLELADLVDHRALA